MAGRYHVSFIAIHLRLDLRSPNSIYWMGLQLKVSAGEPYNGRFNLVVKKTRWFLLNMIRLFVNIDISLTIALSSLLCIFDHAIVK